MIRDIGTRFAEAVAGRPTPAADAAGAVADDAPNVTVEREIAEPDADGNDGHAMLWHGRNDTPPEAA